MFIVVTERGTARQIAVNVARIVAVARQRGDGGASYARLSFDGQYSDDIVTVESWEDVVAMIGTVRAIAAP